MESILGKEKYFVHRWTWENKYEWRIQKVKIKGIKIKEENWEYFVEFWFNSTWYEYPLEYLKDSLHEAKIFAFCQIQEEKNEQQRKIESYTEEDCRKWW